MDKSQMDYMLDLIFSGRLGEAVQFYHASTDADLQTSRKFVEELESKLRESHWDAFYDQHASDEQVSFSVAEADEEQSDLEYQALPDEPQEDSDGHWPIWGTILVVIVIKIILQLFR